MGLAWAFEVSKTPSDTSSKVTPNPYQKHFCQSETKDFRYLNDESHCHSSHQKFTFQSSGLQTFKPIQNYQMGFCFLWLEGSQEGLKEAEGTDKAQEALCTTRGDGEAW